MNEQSYHLANFIYSLLIDECDAPDSVGLRQQFVDFFADNTASSTIANREYRIGGKMGFGFKFWREQDKFYVTQYVEDATKTSIKKLKKTNLLLAELFESQNIIIKEKENVK